MSNLKFGRAGSAVEAGLKLRALLKNLGLLPGLCGMRSIAILRRKKDGDWYIYAQFLAYENFNNVHEKVQKGYNIFKPTIHNVLSTGTIIVKIWLSLCLIRFVRFARYCGKMYSCHLFSYGGLRISKFKSSIIFFERKVVNKSFTKGSLNWRTKSSGVLLGPVHIIPENFISTAV